MPVGIETSAGVCLERHGYSARVRGRETIHDYGSDVYTEADGDDDTLGNLGPLGPLAGIWTSSEGADVHPVGPGSDITGRSSTAMSTTRSLSVTSCTRSTRRPTDRSCSMGCATTPTS
jgi:hypothetical protein